MAELQEDSLVSVQRMNYGQQKLYKVKDSLVGGTTNRSNMSGNRGGSAGPQHSTSQSPTAE